MQQLRQHSPQGSSAGQEERRSKGDVLHSTVQALYCIGSRLEEDVVEEEERMEPCAKRRRSLLRRPVSSPQVE